MYDSNVLLGIEGFKDAFLEVLITLFLINWQKTGLLFLLLSIFLAIFLCSIREKVVLPFFGANKDKKV